MNTQDKENIEELYKSLLNYWNNSDASKFASLFADNCICVGFDGTAYMSAAEISTELGKIFADHKVASYVYKIRSIAPVDEHSALLHAVASMVPPGANQINPERNVVQLLLASRIDDAWRIVAYQNTPARYDGRPEAVRALTEELGGVVGK